jgi:hypothetical protein
VAKSDVQDWDAVAANNTDVGSNNIAEGCAPANINNAIRETMAQLVRELADQGTDITAAGTTNIAATGTAGYVKITGVTTITGFGTPNGNPRRWIQWGAATPVTYNATSMILIGNASRTYAAGDISQFVHEGSGNWRELMYMPDGGWLSTTGAQTITSTAAGTVLTLTSTDAGAGAGPTVILDRNSATPANNDVLGGLYMRGRDSGGNATDYVAIEGQITDVTNGSEDSVLYLKFMVAGAADYWSLVGGSIIYSTQTSKGAGTVSSTGLYVNGHGTIAQVVSDTDATYTTLGTILPVDNSIPQITEGDEVLSVAITPTNASSILRITVCVHIGGGANPGSAGVGLFVDATANAIAAAAVEITAATNMNTMTFVHEVSAASTAARTYRVRAGSSAANDVFLNGNAANRIFGGVAVSSIKVEEVLPQ